MNYTYWTGLHPANIILQLRRVPELRYGIIILRKLLELMHGVNHLVAVDAELDSPASILLIFQDILTGAPATKELPWDEMMTMELAGQTTAEGAFIPERAVVHIYSLLGKSFACRAGLSFLSHSSLYLQ